MSRPEAPVNYSVRAVGVLADRLRAERDKAELTNAELAEGVGVNVSTVRRAASGNQVPKRDLITKWLAKCGNESAVQQVLELWKAARRQDRWRKTGRPARRLPSPALVQGAPMLSAALITIHEQAGAPSAHVMEARAGEFGVLPHSSVDRILVAETLPNSEEQCRAFLLACEVKPGRAEEWVEAWRRVYAKREESLGQILRRGSAVTEELLKEHGNLRMKVLYDPQRLIQPLVESEAKQDLLLFLPSQPRRHPPLRAAGRRAEVGAQVLETEVA